MSFSFLIRTVIEIAGILLLLYGFIREDKLIEFEDKLKARIKKGAKNEQMAQEVRLQEERLLFRRRCRNEKDTSRSS